jgi:hypothetical protein
VTSAFSWVVTFPVARCVCVCGERQTEKERVGGRGGGGGGGSDIGSNLQLITEHGFTLNLQ